MKERGYHPGFSAAGLGCAGSLGTVIPPSIVLIVYGTATGTSIGQLFVNSIGPGILLGLGLMVVAWWISRKNGWKGGEPFTWSGLLTALRESVLALLAPVIIVGGIRFGIFTPTEAAGMGVAYALVVGAFVYRKLTLAKVFGLLRDTTEMTGSILMVIAAASVFGWILTVEQVPQLVVNGITGATESATVALILMMLAVLVLGTFRVHCDHPDPGASLPAGPQGVRDRSRLFWRAADDQPGDRRQYAAAGHRPDGSLPNRRHPDVGIVPLSAAVPRLHDLRAVPSRPLPRPDDAHVLRGVSRPASTTML
jgi:hypothetical protein